jgi:hypothetical protein
VSQHRQRIDGVDLPAAVRVPDIRHAGRQAGTFRSICSASPASIPPDGSQPTCTLTWTARGAPVAYIDSMITCAV